MDYSRMVKGLSEFFQRLFDSMSGVMEWLLTPTEILQWDVAPIWLISGTFLIAGVVACIIR